MQEPCVLRPQRDINVFVSVLFLSCRNHGAGTLVPAILTGVLVLYDRSVILMHLFLSCFLLAGTMRSLVPAVLTGVLVLYVRSASARESQHLSLIACLHACGVARSVGW